MKMANSRGGLRKYNRILRDETNQYTDEIAAIFNRIK